MYHNLREENHRILVLDKNEAIHRDFQKILATDRHQQQFLVDEALLFGSHPMSTLTIITANEDTTVILKILIALGLPT